VKIEVGKPHVRVLDWLRGIAALLVCAAHLRNAMLVDWSMSNDHSLLQRIMYGITGLGHQSVMVFFVLSGYLVGGSVIFAREKFRWTDYLAARLTRLWVVLVPCLMLTWIADSITAQIANDVLMGSYSARWHSAPVAGRYSISWQTLFGNLAFLQTIYFPVYGSNGPLWSLANEFWYYVMFPFALLASGKSAEISFVGRVICSALLSLIFASLPVEIQCGFFVWVIGVFVGYVNRTPHPTTASRLLWQLALLGVFAGVGFSKWSAAKSWTVPWGDWILGLAVGAFLLCALQRAQHFPGKASRLNSIAIVSRHLSDLSFSLYLSHFPLVLLISSYFFHKENLQPTARAWVSYFGIFVGLLMVAQILWWTFERNTPRVRRFVVGNVDRMLLGRKGGRSY
jgi:peptidoglycan/LPS O-acetylase OafA/YrhL